MFVVGSTRIRHRAPGVFGWLAATGRLDDAEMLRTFNCGIGMVLVAGKSVGDKVAACLRDLGESPVVMGDVVIGEGARTAAKGKGEAFAVRYAGHLEYAA